MEGKPPEEKKEPINKGEARNKEIEFLIELIKFFKSSICGTADSVKTLATIEEKFPDQYKNLSESKMDPSQIDKLMGKMSPEDKDTFLIIFARASYIAPKLNKLFDLSLEEKKELTETINKYASFVEEKLTALVKKWEKVK